MLVTSLRDHPYKVLEVLEYYVYDLVLVRTESGTFMRFSSEIYIL